MIELKNVNYKYNKNKVLSNINLKINEGEVICIIGKNGSGKSTLANIIAGIKKPSEGTVTIDEIDALKKSNFIEIRKKVGIVFQNPDSQILFNNVEQDMLFALNNLNIDNKQARIDDSLTQVDMLEFKNFDSLELSLGQKQRVNIASMLAINIKYMVLDEPTTMIDSVEKEKIYEIIKKQKSMKKTIIFITNNINEILLSDKIIVIKNGEIQQIIKKNELM